MSASDASYRLWDTSEAASDDAYHHLPEHWHGPRVDDGVDAAVKNCHPECPCDRCFSLRNQGTHAVREEADEESENDDRESLRHVHVMSE